MPQRRASDMASPGTMVDYVFARCAVRYGSAWLAKWTGLDLDLLKADWAAELAGYERHPRVVAYALEHLPLDVPPNAGQFRELCRGAPEALWDRPPALEQPDLPGVVDPAAKARIAHAVATALAKSSTRRGAQWARDLKARAERGEIRLGIAQREAVEQAIRNAPPDPFVHGQEFKGVPAEVLPPGMRQPPPMPDGRPLPPDPEQR
jgi:hypothetical protein